jgi:hypothetical protein
VIADATAPIDPEVVAGMLADGRFALGDRGPPPTLDLLATMRELPPRMPYDSTPPPGVVREQRRIPGWRSVARARVPASRRRARCARATRGSPSSTST